MDETHIGSLDLSVFSSHHSRLLEATTALIREDLKVFPEGPPKENLVHGCRSVYLVNEFEPRNVKTLIADCLCAWSVLVDDESDL